MITIQQNYNLPEKSREEIQANLQLEPAVDPLKVSVETCLSEGTVGYPSVSQICWKEFDQTVI